MSTTQNSVNSIKKVSHVVPCQLRHFMKRFNFTDSTIKELYARFFAQVKKGLAKSTHPCADIKCFMSYVHSLPTGKEYGKFLAVDIGGANFRILMVFLSGKDKEPEIQDKIYEIPKEVMTGPGLQLFDYIAACLYDLVKSLGLEKERLPLGFTFSFPCRQTSLKVAKLVKWTKGFDCEGVVDQDVGKMLMDAINRRGDLKIELIAIVNDTVGTLMSCSYRNKGCRIGLIVGVGTNACYVEKTENCQLLDPQVKKKHKEVIVNCEWGAFGENGDLDFVKTDYDKEIDSKTRNVGCQIFEKMISGMYMGEVMRLVLIKAVQNKLIFAEESTPYLLEKLRNENMFETKTVARIERDKYPIYRHSEEAIKDILGIANPKVDDCYRLLYIAGCVSRRSATFVGVGLAALVNKGAVPKTIIGIDGSLYKKHPKYECYICKTMKKLVDKRYRYKLMVSEDGTGFGASVIVACNLPGKKQADSNCPK